MSALALYRAVMLEVVHDVVVDEAVGAWHWAAGFRGMSKEDAARARRRRREQGRAEADPLPGRIRGS